MTPSSQFLKNQYFQISTYYISNERKFWADQYLRKDHQLKINFSGVIGQISDNNEKNICPQDLSMKEIWKKLMFLHNPLVLCNILLNNPARYVWGQALIPLQDLPNIMLWGWKEDCTPVWMTQDEASKALQILKHCKCKKNCSLHLSINWITLHWAMPM